MGASSSKLVTDPAKLAGKQFDYVIIGGGTAGCVLASRLSEDSSVSVLLIEAGKTNDGVLFSQIPLAFPKLYKGQYDWNYETVPQPGLGDRKLYWPRGKMLGGSSSINAVMYHHCSPSDFDEWGKLTDSAPNGSPKWSYDILRPYFLKSEKFSPPTFVTPNKFSKEVSAKYAKAPDALHGLRASERRHMDLDVSYRGMYGPWQTSYGPFNTLCEDAIAAGEKIGIPYTADFNTPKGTLGTSLFPGFVGPNGHRSSAATAYLTSDVHARTNLTIAIDCCVTSILLNEDASSVECVEVAGMPTSQTIPSLVPSEKWRVVVKKEAILSAGVVGTPQILMLSGIGPKEDLERVDIKLVKEIDAVGKNLIDHLVTTIAFRAAPNTTLGYLNKAFGGLMPLFRWLTTGGGIYSAIAVQAAAFVRMDDKNLPTESGIMGAVPLMHRDNTSGPTAPDVELLYMAAPYINHGLTPPPKGSEVFTTVSFFGKQDPLRKKLLLPTVGETVDKSYTNIFWPGDADPETITDDELRDVIKRDSETVYHPVGTARMGTNPETSVVDTSLRVHGIMNLRIVDASIFPSQLSGHPTAPIIAIAERAADLIKGV